MAVPSNVVEAIDTKIADMEKELERLRRAAELLPKVESDLSALKRTRSMFTGEDTATVAPMNPPMTIARSGSIASMLGEILLEAGKPLHLNDIYLKLQGKGGKASKATVTSTLIRLMKNGKLERTTTSTYSLARKQ
jgi:hypothetical protein